MTILPAKMEQLEYMGRIVENDADYKFVKKRDEALRAEER